MVRTRSDHIVLWPTYFDSRKSRADGRRVPKSKSIDRPTAEEIYKIVRTLGLKGSVHKDKAHPSSWWEEEGAVFVEKGMLKTQLIQKVASKLKDIEHNRENK
jgi:signal recognition particle subunit SRP19